MKIYTQTYSLKTPSEGRFWTTQYSDIAVGLKVADALSATLTLKDSAGNTLTPEDDKVNGFTVWKMTTQGAGSETYTLSLNSSDIKFKLVRIVTDSTVYDIDETGDMSDYYTKEQVDAQLSTKVDESVLTAYALTSDIPDVSGKVNNLSGVADIMKISQADYDILSAGGTADANTLYVIV